VRFSSYGLIGRHMGFWGLDEAGLARDLRGRSSTEILSVLDELNWEDRDDVSYEYARQSSIDELAELDNAVINRMIDENGGRLDQWQRGTPDRASPPRQGAKGSPGPTTAPTGHRRAAAHFPTAIASEAGIFEAGRL
jgi:hypothetical protein